MKVFLLILLVVKATSEAKSQVLTNFAAGSMQFTANVYQELAKVDDRSFIVSPLSVEVLLALFHAGAKGKTAKELSEGLYLPADRAKIDETFTKLSSLLKRTRCYYLISANKVYLNHGFQINAKFKTTAVNVFNVELENPNFRKNQEAADEMNDWVEDKTLGEIKNVVIQKDLEDNPVSVLINAMYFRGEWVKQFNSSRTKKRPFHVTEDDEIQVEMMKMSGRFTVSGSEELGAQFLEMPYSGKDTADVLGSHTRYHNTRARVVIPKFKMETSIQFKSILEAIGIKEPFSNNSDFSGFGANKDHLVISKIIQKTLIQVEEKGTTAAAASAGFNTFNIGPGLAAPVVEFVADHPFIYYIKIKGIIVFVGRYTGS